MYTFTAMLQAADLSGPTPRLANDAQIPHVITQARRVLMRRMRLLLGGTREGAVANSEMASGDKWGPLLELHTNGKKDMVMDMGRVLRCVRTRRLPRHTCCKSGQARTMSNRSIFDMRFTRNIQMNGRRCNEGRGKTRPK